ncbi:MAG: reverse transcriptase-like protein, partial [Gammaproteobacteria bacterium]|nr:reverse transcriptase-like protein [Gammaproteobacteria bacterium]
AGVYNKLGTLGFKANAEKSQCMFFNNKYTQKEDEKIVLKTEDGEFTLKGQNKTKWLGVTFDKKLTFIPHLEEAEKKGLEALNILKSISGKEWGINTKSRLLLLKNFLLPKICYGEEVFHTGAITGLKKLDRIQNSALRIITSMPRSTPIKALQVMTDVPPLEIRRKQNLVKLWARFRHNPNNPANNIYNDRIQYKKLQSSAQTTTHLTKTMKLNTEKIAILPEVTPDWTTYNYIQADTTLISTIENNSDQAPSLLVNDLLYTRYRDHLKYFTDGSKKDNKVGAGYYLENKEEKQIKLENYLSITSAELVAILEALKHALGYVGKDIAICTDCLTAIRALQGNRGDKARPDLVKKIKDTLNLHRVRNNNIISIIWVPAHQNIEGNERADKIANQGRKQNINFIKTGLGPKEIKNYIEHNIHQKLVQKDFEDASGKSIEFFRKCHPHINFPLRIEPHYNKINRLKCRVPIFRILYIQAGGIYCRKCRCLITVEHVLMDCVYFREERKNLQEDFRKEKITFNTINLLSMNRAGTLLKKIIDFVDFIDTLYPI